MKLPPDARFPTICIHAGQMPDAATGAIITPIYQTSTYVQEELGKHKGFEYARTQNPTRSALEANIAAIEKDAVVRISRDHVTVEANGRSTAVTGKNARSVIGQNGIADDRGDRRKFSDNAATVDIVGE